ncbi:MAG TPA: dihydrolipoamide acetyltransferase family protein [Candidatus Limnocylindrales bacterium]|nr:dihydrolipoamide acetyltransferase family protein [Candidatus Limnocylindrales bacterium]
MPTDVVMPQLGESVIEGTILHWHKQVGDRVDSMETLLEISTDKVDAEIPAPAAGVLLEILVPEGETVVKGTRLAVIGEEPSLRPSPPAPRSVPTSPPGPLSVHREGETVRPAQVSPLPGGEGLGARASGVNGPHITPVVARMAAEHQLDLAQIRGTGHEGRVTKKDVDAYLSAQTAGPAVEPDLPPWERPGTGDLFKPSVDYEASKPLNAPPAQPADGGARQALPQPSTSRPEGEGTGVRAEPGELVALTPMRHVIAERLTQTAQSVPMVTTVFEVDLSAVLAHRAAHKADYARQGVHLTLTAYFALASVAALQAVPALNSEWRANGIFMHSAVNLGVAVALDPGLIVPVIRHAESLNLLGLARAVNDAAERARAGQLAPDDTQGSTFTITNHGTGGSLLARPILNAPNAGILGVGMVEKRVRVQTDAQGRDALTVCPCVYLTLTFDHRLADGAEGDAFLRTVKEMLEGWS